VLWSFLYFFALLSSYYLLRPVREEMGIRSGVENLQWLFTGTFVATAIALPIFGAMVVRWPRRRLLPAVYWGFAGQLAAFFFVMEAGLYAPAVAAAFFIWLSVFNVFVVSVFWSFMADIFSNEQARRLYGPIAAGGTIGAITGPALTAILVNRVGVANLLLIAAVLLGLAVFCIGRLDRWAVSHPKPQREGEEKAVGGTIWAGVRLTISSRYLAGIAAFVLLLTVLATVIYFEQARVVEASSESSAQRTQIFAQIDLAVNALTVVTQLFVTNRLIGAFGVAGVLTGVMLLNGAGYLALGIAPSLTTLAVFQVFRRAMEYSLIRPAREVLFTVTSREEKYKAKNFIDTVVFRGGDVVSAWLVAAFQAVGAGVLYTAFFAATTALAAAVLGWSLGRRQETLRAQEHPVELAPAERKLTA